MKRGRAELDGPADSRAPHLPAAISAPLICMPAVMSWVPTGKKMLESGGSNLRATHVRQLCTWLRTGPRRRRKGRARAAWPLCVHVFSVPSVTCTCRCSATCRSPTSAALPPPPTHPPHPPVRVWNACCACRGNALLPRQLNTLIWPACTPQPCSFLACVALEKVTGTMRLNTDTLGSHVWSGRRAAHRMERNQRLGHKKTSAEGKWGGFNKAGMGVGGQKGVH